MRGEIHAHKTMLIHVSRLTKVQKEIQKQVQDEIEELRDILNQNISSEKKSLIDELEQIYDEDFLTSLMNTQKRFGLRLSKSSMINT